MNATIWAAIISTLKADTALVTLLGGDYIYEGHITQNVHFPCLSVDAGNESSRRQPGYAVSKHRNQEAMIQVNAWVRTTPAALAAIMNRVEEVLIPDGVTNTYEWEKVSETAPWDPSTKTHHGSQRFRFLYQVAD